MSMKDVQDAYQINVKRGQRVRVKAFDGWTDGRLTSATHYVIIAPDKWPNARLRCHPTDRDKWFPIVGDLI
jgi:hypothetical protein